MESRQCGVCSLRPLQLLVGQGSLEDICAEWLEVSREDYKSHIGAKGWWDQGKTGMPGQRSFRARESGKPQALNQLFEGWWWERQGGVWWNRS